MKYLTRILGFTFAGLFLASCSIPSATSPPASDSSSTSLSVTTPKNISLAPGTCHYGPNQTADPTCTPGAIDPRVTQANLDSTICVSGYTTTVRPPSSVTAPIKVEMMAAYGVSGQPKSGFELDHSIPLELGGSSDLANLWPEPALPIPGFHQKDTLENGLNKLVCNHTLPLATAQAAIATNWYSAYTLYCLQRHQCFAYDSGN